MSNAIANNRSALKDFLGSVATVSGDLSNITAPPFVLSENSTVEIPQYWADHPSLFVSQAAEEDAEKRSLSVLKYFIGTLRNQQYAGRSEGDGVKKPLNAFLGEVFLGHWKDEEIGETHLVAEQVSHHPPVTACYLWNDKHGVRAQGFTQQEITFSGNVSIKQKGFAILHLDRWDEDYLIPVPDIKVKGILTGVPYPELAGDYSLISSNGYISHIKFSGKSFFGSGQKNSFEAKLFHADKPGDILYTAKGAWNGKLAFHNARSGEEIDSFDVHDIKSAKVQTAPLSEQDPWESRNAWRDVIAALHNGDMRGVASAKSRLEDGQRQMRADEEAQGKQWQTFFFENVAREPIFDKLSALDPGSFTVDKAGGIWKAKREVIESMERPFHGDLLPNNERAAGPAKKHLEHLANGNGVNAPQQNGIAATTETQDHGERKEDTVPANTANVNDSGLRKGDDNGVQGPSEAQDHRTKKEETASNSAGEINNLALRPKHHDVEEQQRAQGISAPTCREPTDAEVEDFLRAKHSNWRP